MSDLLTNLKPLLPDLSQLALWGIEGVLAFGLLALAVSLVAGLASNIPVVGPFAASIVRHMGKRFQSHIERELERIADEAVRDVEERAAEEIAAIAEQRPPRAERRDAPPLITSVDKRKAAMHVIKAGAAQLGANKRFDELERELEQAHKRMRKAGLEQKAAAIWAHADRKGTYAND